MGRVCQTVKRHNLDIGLAFDGDAHRAVVLDKQVQLAPPYAAGGLIALHLLKNHPGATIPYGLWASRALP